MSSHCWADEIIRATDDSSRRVLLKLELQRRQSTATPPVRGGGSSDVSPDRRQDTRSSAVGGIPTRTLLALCREAFAPSDSDCAVDVCRMTFLCLKEDLMTAMPPQRSLGGEEPYDVLLHASSLPADVSELARCLFTCAFPSPSTSTTTSASSSPLTSSSALNAHGRVVVASRLIEFLLEQSGRFLRAAFALTLGPDCAEEPTTGVAPSDSPEVASSGAARPSPTHPPSDKGFADTCLGRVMSALISPHSVGVLHAWDVFEALTSGERALGAAKPELEALLCRYASEHIEQIVFCLRSNSYVSRRRMLRHVATAITFKSCRERLFTSPALLCALLMLATEDASSRIQLEAYHALKNFLIFPRPGVANHCILFANREGLSWYLHRLNRACEAVIKRAASGPTTAALGAPTFGNDDVLSIVAGESLTAVDAIAQEITNLRRRLSAMKPPARLDVDAFVAACHHRVVV